MMRSLTRREQTLFISCMAVVFLCLYYWALIVPLQEKRNVIRAETAIYREQTEKDAQIMQSAKMFAGRYHAYQSRFPESATGRESSSVAADIEEIAGRLGVHITNLKSEDGERDPYQYRFSAEVALIGGLSKILHFIYTAQQDPHVFIVDAAQFERSVTDKEDMVTARFVLSKIFLASDMSNGTESSLEKEASSKELTDVERKPFEAYARNIQQRDLFFRRDALLGPENKALRAVLPALHQRIKLVGILLDKDSQAIVEDLQRREVHFLSKGDHVGEILLEDIREDKAVFLYNNERIEMRL